MALKPRDMIVTGVLKITGGSSLFRLNRYAYRCLHGNLAMFPVSDPKWKLNEGSAGQYTVA